MRKLKQLWAVFLMLLVPSLVLAQDRTVSGTVLSGEDNSPLPGVNIQVKGTTTGTQTDFEGKYQLKVNSSDAVLVFSFVGFEPKEIVVGNQSNLIVTLAPDVKTLSEVVVVGYGTQIKTDVTANIAQVQGKEIQNVAVPSVEGALQGRAAGVFIESGNGKVGQGMKVRVRGAASLSASNQPLYVVDGVIINTQDLSVSNASTNPLADINFNDIESMEILKDAASSAIYGARGSNGVVIITTKKGKAGATKFNLGAQYGFSNPTRLRDFLNAQQYVELYKEAYTNDGYDAADAEADLDFFSIGRDWRNNAVNTDWQREVFPKNRPFQQFDFSASGGSEKTKFYASLNHLDQNGIIIKNQFKRTSGRLNLDHTINDKWKLGTSVLLSRTFNNRVAADNEFANPIQIVALPPISPIRKDDGSLVDTPDGLIYYNPLVEVEKAQFHTYVNRTINNSYLSYEPIKGLMIRGEFGMDLLQQNEDRFWASTTETGRGAGSAAVGQSRRVGVQNYLGKMFANYNKTFGDHGLDATIGTEYQESSSEVTSVTAQAMPDVIKKLIAAGQITGGNSQWTGFKFRSYFARANYRFKGKYLLGFTVRRDESTRFGRDQQGGNFPSASLGWILTEESFLKENKIVSFLKLRASWGNTGNAEIGNFDPLTLYTGAAYAGAGGLRLSQLRNPALTWEKATQYDVGLDFGLFNNRISGEIDYFQKESTGLLLTVPQPSTSGIRSQTQNRGGMVNKGWEIVLNTNNLVGDFKWNTNFNITFITNEVTDLGGQQAIDNGGSRQMNVARVGYPIGTFWGPEYAGVNAETGDPQWYLNDPAAADPRALTSNYALAQFVNLGNPNPRFFGGFNNTFSYKGFDLSVLFQFVSGNKIHLSGDTFMNSQFGNGPDNQTTDILRRWRKPGDVTDVPRASIDGVTSDGVALNGFQGRNGRYLQDGSYLRLKTLNFGYTLPATLVKKAKLSTVRVYVAAQNLLTFTKYTGWDPEVSTDYLTSGGSTNGNLFQGVDFYSAPQAKTVTFGLNVGF